MNPGEMRSVYGIGAALIDYTFLVPDSLLDQLGLKRGTMELVSSSVRAELFDRLQSHGFSVKPAGSTSAALQVVAALGGQATLHCVVGNDEMADLYCSKMAERRVELDVTRSHGVTGACVILVTPDGERTMRTDPGVANQYTSQLASLSQFEWVCMSAHLLLGGCFGSSVIMQAISAARSSGTNVAFSLGSASAMKKYPREALEIIAQSDLVVGNMLEWSSLLEIQGKAGTISELRALCPTMIATMGGAGVEIFHEGELTTIPPVPCTPKNATGAGDVFLGSILYSLVHSRNVLEAAYEATSLASRSVAEGFEQLLLSLRESR